MKKPLGPSFPFMENDGDDIHLAYTSFKIVKTKKRLSVTFYQDSTPIYAYTYELDDSDYEVDFKDLTGTVKINITR